MAQLSAYYPAVESLFHEFLKKDLLSGAVIGILHQESREIWTVGSGVSEDSLFELGSVSKVFTGLLLTVMVERGMIRLDDPIHAYLPSEFAAKIGNRPIRIRDLVLHRSGLPLRASNAGRMKRHIHDPHYGYDVRDLMEELRRYDLQRPEVQQHIYSNLGYALLGHALEKAGGAPFSTLMETFVLRPLGVTDTCLELSADHANRMPRCYTQVGRKAMRWEPSAFTPCGGTCSTANDCLQLLQLFLNPSGPLKTAIEGMLRPDLRPEEGNVLTWKQQSEKDWLWHNGVTDGFTSYLSFHPERGLGIVLLTNRYAVALVTDLGQRIQSVLLNQTPPPVSGRFGTAKAYAGQGLIDFVESPLWLRAGLAGLATGILSYLLR